MPEKPVTKYARSTKNQLGPEITRHITNSKNGTHFDKSRLEAGHEFLFTYGD